MKLWDEYLLATSVKEALETFASEKDSAALVAGGTDLFIDLKAEDIQSRPRTLIDVTSIPELQGIEIADGRVRLGAATTHAEIISHEFLRSRATALVEGCQVIGGPQVRNVATVGGNVAHALPAADSTLGLIALGAEAQIATLTENGDIARRWVPMADLFAGPGKNTLLPYRELLVAFRFQPPGEGAASAFRRIMRPQGIALPIMGLACFLQLDDQKKIIEDARIVPGPIAPVPTRARETENILVGAESGEELFARAEAVAREECQPRTSKYRATAEYRNKMIRYLLRDALRTADYRARTGDVKIGKPFIGERGVRPNI